MSRLRKAVACSLTKSEGRDFRERWQLVNVREIDELRKSSFDVKWRQFLSMLNWSKQFNWTAELSDGVDQVRARWARLRKVCGG